LQQLLIQYFENTITRADCEELLVYLDEGDPLTISATIDEVLKVNPPEILKFDRDKKTDVYDRLIAEIHQRQTTTDQQSPSRKFSVVPWIKVAALLVAAVSVAILLYNNKQSDLNMPAVVSPNEKDITLPEYNEA